MMSSSRSIECDYRASLACNPLPPTAALSAGHPGGLLQQFGSGGKEIEPWLARRASADPSIFPGGCIHPVNSTSQWRTLILVNSQNSESMRWLSHLLVLVPNFQVRAKIIPRIGNKTMQEVLSCIVLFNLI
jgi:hypothetical protein